MKIGPYEVIKRIGQGGFGYVYQAEHLLLKEKACLKQNQNQDKEDAAMLRAEAKLLWNLSEYHSIPSAKDFIELGKNNYVMVMSYIEGETLEDKVSSKGSIHPEDALWITERLLGALYYCHYNGVVHSDVKPGNVFVEVAKHDIKLIDFGLAAYKPHSSSKSNGYTPMFAAPELKQEMPPIPETDIYGAGMCLLYALGGNIAKKCLPEKIPKPLEDFCNQLIRHDPNQRPNWEKDNPIERLSDIRQELFGRRHMSR